jgi:peptide/nickel transport system substrate-binding protein
VRYKLRQGVQWSDGKSLTADDSLFSYEVARSLYPAVRQEILARTYQYQTLDSYTLEWQGVPGFWPSSALTYFFDPLPRHAWGEIPPEELLKSESVNYLPLSYGPYQIDNWLPGDSITFSRNPYYFRSGEGLPRFDQLVFRFVPQAEEAISLLEQGECDLLDETYHLEQHKELQEMVRNSAHSELVIKNNTAWEQITFGISPVSGVSPLSSREFRQAISQCIDRQRIVDTLFDGGAVLNQYIPPEHPLADPQANPAPFDTQGASLLLEELGWVDADGSPDTFRVSSGIAGIPDGQELVLTFLSDDDASSLVTAEILKESFAACGAKLESRALPVEQLLSPGPDGEIFGRKFQLAKFAWQSSVEPPCFLFTTAAIPGEYPRYPLGWGGGNAAGYSDPVFDFQCSLVLSILPDENQSLELSHQLQDLIEQDLPFLPLYSHVQLLAKRSEICGLRPDPSAPSSFWNLEELERNPQCEPTP